MWICSGFCFCRWWTWKGTFFQWPMLQPWGWASKTHICEENRTWSHNTKFWWKQLIVQMFRINLFWVWGAGDCWAQDSPRATQGYCPSSAPSRMPTASFFPLKTLFFNPGLALPHSCQGIWNCSPTRLQWDSVSWKGSSDVVLTLWGSLFWTPQKVFPACHFLSICWHISCETHFKSVAQWRRIIPRSRSS